jgi:selenocysteine lyase/cysteine desulfurase
VEGLRALPGVRVFHPDEEAADAAGWLAVVAFAAADCDPGRVAWRLDRCGILCRPGLQCAPRAHRTLGTWPTGTVRLSPAPSVRDDEVAAALREVAAAIEGERAGR